MSHIVSQQKSSDDIGFGSTLQKLALIKVGICIGIIGLYNLVYFRKEGKGTTIETVVELTKDKKTSVKSTIKDDNKIEIKIERSKRSPTVIKSKMNEISPSKKKTTLSESMKELSKSKELKAMATMVFCYNTCVELTEVLWKGILRKSYPNKADYMSFMANFSQQVGMIALLLQLSASTIIDKLGWKWSASLTPLTMAILAIPFFISVIFIDNNHNSATGSVSTLAMALLIGTWQNVANKVTKYSLFDPCKEMAYIPLGPEAKTKGKAAVEVLGARLGRSMGSATQQVLVSAPFIGNGSILNCAPYIGFAYMLTVGYWLKAVKILGELFTSSTEYRAKQKKLKE